MKNLKKAITKYLNDHDFEVSVILRIIPNDRDHKVHFISFGQVVSISISDKELSPYTGYDKRKHMNRINQLSGLLNLR